MSDSSPSRISDQVQKCLQHCLDSSAPLANLADFREKMRGEGWPEEDIRQVELVALKVLASLASPGEPD